MVNVKTCMEIGRLARDIRASANAIKRYEKDIVDDYAKLIALMPENSIKPTVEEIINMDQND